MALDPVVLNLGSGGDSIGTDNVGGVNYEITKVAYGDADTITRVDETNPLPVKQTTSSTSTITAVGDSASSVTLKAANSARKGLTIFNDSTAVLYIKLGATASTSSYTFRAVQYAYYEVPYGYTGQVDGIWASDAGGQALVDELT